MFVHMYIYAYVYEHVYIHEHVYKHAYIHVLMCTWIHIDVIIPDCVVHAAIPRVRPPAHSTHSALACSP